MIQSMLFYPTPERRRAGGGRFQRLASPTQYRQRQTLREMCMGVAPGVLYRDSRMESSEREFRRRHLRLQIQITRQNSVREFDCGKPPGRANSNGYYPQVTIRQSQYFCARQSHAHYSFIRLLIAEISSPQRRLVACAISIISECGQ